LTDRGISAGRGGVTDVLMVTTTVGMLDGVHGDTSHSGPVLLLGLVFVVRVVGSQERLVASLSAGNDADHGSAASEDGFTNAGGESDSGLLAIFGVTDDDAGSTGGTGEGASVSELGLAGRNDGSLRHAVEGHDIANLQRSFFARIHKHAGVHTFDGDEILSAVLVSVCVSENNLSEGRSSAGIVNNVPDDTLSVSLSLHEVEGSELCRCYSLVSVSFKDSAASASLGSDASSHD